MSDDGSYQHMPAADDFNMGFNMMGGTALFCPQCYQANFKHLETSIVCANCGVEVSQPNHNATLEYQDIHKGKMTKIKNADVREKNETPKKLSQLRRDISKVDAGNTGFESETGLEQKGFMLQGHGQASQESIDNKFLLEGKESWKDYIKAYEEMVKSIAARFSDQHLSCEKDKKTFNSAVQAIYNQYMQKWKQSNNIKPISSLTIPRRGQLRDQISNKYSHLKRTFLQEKDDQAQEEDQEQEKIQSKLYEISKQTFNKHLKRVRRRTQKGSDKVSNGSTTAHSTSYMMKSNFLPEIQDLTTEDSAQLLLQFNSIECILLSLLQRAKLFVKLKYKQHNSKLQSQIQSLKFKQTSNILINDQTLPSKNILIKILRDQLFLDYKQVPMEGLKSVKDKIILLIYIYHKVVPSDKQFQRRKELQEYLFDQYWCEYQHEKQIFPVEEVLLSQFEKQLEEYPDILKDFRQYAIDDEKEEEEKAKPPSHSLELNLILVFIYMAGKPFGILEKDILQSAAKDSNGYLTEYTKYKYLCKSEYLLRPINVPTKNKWLRDTAHSFNTQDQIDSQSWNLDLVILRIQKDLEIPQILIDIAIKIGKRGQKQNQDYTVFDVVACVILTFKLVYGLNDSEVQPTLLQQELIQLGIHQTSGGDVDDIIKMYGELPDYSSLIYQLQTVIQKKCDQPLWRVHDVDKLDDLQNQLNFAEKHIFSESTKNQDDEKFTLKVSNLASRFSQDFCLYKKQHKVSQSPSKFKSAIQLTHRFSQSFQQSGSHQQAINPTPVPPTEETKSEDSENEPEQEQKELLPSSRYIKYNFKFHQYDQEFYHFDFMHLVSLFQAYLGEPTSHDLIKAYKHIEKTLFMQIKQ